MLTCEYLKSLLKYDPETGIFVWISPRSAISIGRRAGCVQNHGYRSIKIDRKSYLEHRLAFMYMTGEFPTYQVDHINNNPIDNRWCNLRAATQSENQFNTRKQSNNTSGFKGVCLHKQSGRWQMGIAYTDETGCVKRISRLFGTAEEAAASYEKFAKEFQKTFKCENI